MLAIVHCLERISLICSNRDAGRYLVEPMRGLMVMFPSWLKHMVHPFHDPGETDIDFVHCDRTSPAANNVRQEGRRPPLSQLDQNT